MGDTATLVQSASPTRGDTRRRGGTVAPTAALMNHTSSEDIMPVLLWPLIGPVRIEKSVTSLYEVARQTRQRGRRGARTRGGIEKRAGLRALTGRLVIVVRRSTPSDTDIRAADPASAGVEVRVRIVGNQAEELLLATVGVHHPDTAGGGQSR